MNTNHCTWLAATLLALTGTMGVARAQTITVDIEEADIIDVDPNTATVADLPGPDGHISFSEAMIASNNTPGRQTVGFAIPTSEWTYLSWYYPGRAVVHGMMVYGNAYDEVTIDGRTQTAFTGDTNPDGWEVVILRGGGLYIPADNCTIAGLDNTSIYIEGSNNVVENNSTMGLDIYGGLGGSGNLVKDNTGGGYVQIVQSNDNVIVGNTVDRVRVLGWIAGGQPATNNRIGGPTLAERNHIIGLGTRSEHGYPSGFGIQLFNSIGTLIENNWIGMSPDGLAPGHPYTTAGIYFDTENYDTTIRNNRIAGILAWVVPPHSQAYQVGSAIELNGAGSGVTIVGNKIGLNADDEPVLGSVTGISTVHFFYPNGIQNVVIGGAAAGEGNEIAGHLDTGISVAYTYSGVRITGNSVHDNGGLGIDLITDLFEAGVTPNDILDADTGGNGLQNFPILASAGFTSGALHVTGVLHSSPLDEFTVEFFASPTCDPTGYGEGAVFFGSATVLTDALGDATLDVLVPTSVPNGWFVTATATLEPIGATSEFAACVPVEGGASAVFRNAGTNPASYSAVTLPVLGTSYSAAIDLAGTSGHNLAWLVGYGTPITLPLGGGQTLLVNTADPSGELLGQAFLSGPVATYSLPVPADPAFAGFALSTQALHLGGVQPWVLSNAQDLLLGY